MSTKYNAWKKLKNDLQKDTGYAHILIMSAEKNQEIALLIEQLKKTYRSGTAISWTANGTGGFTGFGGDYVAHCNTTYWRDDQLCVVPIDTLNCALNSYGFVAKKIYVYDESYGLDHYDTKIVIEYKP
jgi:hypothetical protein